MDYQKDNNVREEYGKLDISDRKEQEEDDEGVTTMICVSAFSIIRWRS